MYRTTVYNESCKLYLTAINVKNRFFCSFNELEIEIAYRRGKKWDMTVKGFLPFCWSENISNKTTICLLYVNVSCHIVLGDWVRNSDPFYRKSNFTFFHFNTLWQLPISSDSCHFHKIFDICRTKKSKFLS